MQQLQADVGDAERRCHQMRLQFEDLGRQMRQELERFEREKVEDFRMGVETYLESAVEAQKEVSLFIKPLHILACVADRECSSSSCGKHTSCTLTRTKRKSRARPKPIRRCRFALLLLSSNRVSLRRKATTALRRAIRRLHLLQEERWSRKLDIVVGHV